MTALERLIASFAAEKTLFIPVHATKVSGIIDKFRLTFFFEHALKLERAAGMQVSGRSDWRSIETFQSMCQ